MKKRVKDDAFSRSEISLTPLAMPMLAGPGAISLLIAYNQEYKLINNKVYFFELLSKETLRLYAITSKKSFYL